MIHHPAPYDLKKVLWEPPARLCLIWGAPLVFRLSNYLILRHLARGETVMFLDGGNTFDPYRITEAAKILGRGPRDFLNRIKISRAFTCHQMEALLQRTGWAVKRFNSSLVVISGFLGTFYDEDVPDREATRLFRSSLRRILNLSQNGACVLVVCPEHCAPTRRNLISSLGVRADRVIRCLDLSHGDLVIRLEKPASRRMDWVIPKGDGRWEGRY